MTVLLVICMFALFVALDFAIGRHRAVQPARPLAVVVPETQPALEPVWVSGYQLPEGLHYHRGHTWARVLDANTVLVGLDDFARKLIGTAKGLRLPAVGSWLKQGRSGFQIQVNGRSAEFVSPVEGEVAEVNQHLPAAPSLATDDPYGRGWVMKLRVSDLAGNLRNLLSGGLARLWMQGEREGLELRLMALSGSVLQDGGEPVADFARHLPEEEWKRLVSDFLLT